MKQFVLGLIVAAVAWWGYGKWSGTEAFAHLGGGRVPAPEADARDVPSDVPRAAPDGGATARMQDVLGVDGGAGAAAEAPAPSGDVGALIERINRREPGAIGAGWLALAGGRVAGDRAALVDALRARGEDFASRLEALGPHNAFLRSSEGRAAARAATAAAMALPDEQALEAGTALIYRMVCGRIERGDLEWRKVVEEARVQHRVRVDRWLCDPTNVAGARTYTVKSGDSLDRISRRFRKQQLKVESGTIAVLNRVTNPNALHVGQKLKIPVDPVSAVLEKDSYALMLFVGDQLLRLYWVGHGANDHTPVTEFEVIAKHARPEWTAPNGQVYPYGHPENVLGEYFVKFGHAQYSGFGAHGTPDEDTICTQSSMGCIRMFAQDIEELFKVLPRGAKVVVRETVAG